MNVNDDFAVDPIATAKAEERARIAAILALPEAKTRLEPAIKLALTTDMTADTVQPILAMIPEPKPPQSEFEKHMAKLGNPQVGPDPSPDHIEASESAGLWKQAFNGGSRK